MRKYGCINNLIMWYLKLIVVKLKFPALWDGDGHLSLEISTSPLIIYQSQRPFLYNMCNTSVLLLVMLGRIFILLYWRFCLSKWSDSSNGNVEWHFKYICIDFLCCLFAVSSGVNYVWTIQITGTTDTHLKSVLYVSMNLASLLKIYVATLKAKLSNRNVKGQWYSVKERRRLSHSPCRPWPRGSANAHSRSPGAWSRGHRGLRGLHTRHEVKPLHDRKTWPVCKD